MRAVCGPIPRTGSTSDRGPRPRARGRPAQGRGPLAGSSPELTSSSSLSRKANTNPSPPARSTRRSPVTPTPTLGWGGGTGGQEGKGPEKTGLGGLEGGGRGAWEVERGGRMEERVVDHVAGIEGKCCRKAGLGSGRRTQARTEPRRTRPPANHTTPRPTIAQSTNLNLLVFSGPL